MDLNQLRKYHETDDIFNRVMGNLENYFSKKYIGEYNNRKETKFLMSDKIEKEFVYDKLIDELGYHIEDIIKKIREKEEDYNKLLMRSNDKQIHLIYKELELIKFEKHLLNKINSHYKSAFTDEDIDKIFSISL